MATTLKSILPQLIAAIPKNADKVAEKAANMLVDTMQASFKEPKGSRDRHGKPVSVAGEPPASDVGRNLYESLDVEKIDQGHWAAYSDTKVAVFLEYGTKHMAPRPFATPAAEKVASEVEQMLKDEIFKL